MGMYTQMKGKILLRPNTPEIVDKVLYWLMRGDIYSMSPDFRPAQFRSEWRFDDDRGPARLNMDIQRFPSLLNKAGQEDGDEARRIGRELYFDFNIKNYCLEIERFLHWVHPYAESWGLLYRYEEWEDFKPVIKTVTGFEVNGSPYRVSNTVMIMDESLGV